MALKGLKVIEIMGLAPGPFCGSILADFGASVTVVQKVEPAPFSVMNNGKKMLAVDLKTKEGVDIVKKLCSSSDIILDTFRPNVMEKLGLGPETVMKINPRLIYARLTGYGQNGLYKDRAGHDINYVAMSGVLSLLSKNKNPPSPPINLLADFAGGSLTCVLGILLALLERNQSGKGQVIDCSMTEGAAYLASWLFRSRNLPIWGGEPGKNALDGGLPCYKTYETKDGKFMAVGALEPQFYSLFIRGLQLSEEEYGQTDDSIRCEQKFKEVFLSKTQEEWSEIFENIDACVTPVLDFDNVDKHKYHKLGKTFVRDENNILVPKPEPKLSRTPGITAGVKPSPKNGQHTVEILKELGYSKSDIEMLISTRCVYANKKSKI